MAIFPLGHTVIVWQLRHGKSIGDCEGLGTRLLVDTAGYKQNSHFDSFLLSLSSDCVNVAACGPYTVSFTRSCVPSSSSSLSSSLYPPLCYKM